MDESMYQYKQIMEQVEYPAGAKSTYTIVCTEQQAAEMIGQLYKDNPSWRIVFMERGKLFSTATRPQGAAKDGE